MRALKAARLQDLPLSAAGQLAGIIHAIVIAATEVDVELLEQHPTTLDYPQPIRGAVRNACEALSIVSVGSLLAHFQDRDASKRLQEALGTRARLLQVEACLKRAMAEADSAAQAPAPPAGEDARATPRKSPADEAAASVALDGDTRSVNDLVMPEEPPEGYPHKNRWRTVRAKMNEVLRHAATGVSAGKAAAAGGVSAENVRLWGRRHPRFKELLDCARQIGGSSTTPTGGAKKPKPQQKVATPDTTTGIPDTPAQDVVETAQPVGAQRAAPAEPAAPYNPAAATTRALTASLREKQAELIRLRQDIMAAHSKHADDDEKIKALEGANAAVYRRLRDSDMALKGQQAKNLQLSDALAEIWKHPTLAGLFNHLPAPGNTFGFEKRLAWLRAIAAVFEVAYGGSHGRHISIDSYQVVQEVL